ncbi:MAG: hypothetical protein ABW072_00590 [Sedimenticola sp.]
MREPSPFESPEQFRVAFERQLASLLSEFDELGVYILVLANACLDRPLWANLSESLKDKFHYLAREIAENHQEGLLLDDADDDLLVFRRLMETGFDNLQATSFRTVGPWELQFNQLRSFRPPRMSGRPTEGISAPFNPDGFHFNKPFLRKEIFWQGWLAGRDCALLYNKFPFVELHGLLVPEPRKERSQLLSEEDNDYLWRLTELLDRTLPGVGFGYNSYGAGASVNHLHFQMFLRGEPLPVASDNWQHNGGDVPYPARCHRFDSPRETWQMITSLHRQQITYNLVYLPGVVYCLPRARHGLSQPAGWSGGFAWYEMAGGVTLFDEGLFNELERLQVDEALTQISLPAV